MSSVGRSLVARRLRTSVDVLQEVPEWYHTRQQPVGFEIIYQSVAEGAKIAGLKGIRTG